MNDGDVTRLLQEVHNSYYCRFTHTSAPAKIYAPSCWRSPPRRTLVPSLAASKVGSFVVSPAEPLFLYLTHRPPTGSFVSVRPPRFTRHLSRWLILRTHRLIAASQNLQTTRNLVLFCSLSARCWFPVK